MDPIADMLIIIKNGYMAKKSQVVVPYSKFKFAIAKVLEKNNFLEKVEKEGNKINLKLAYFGKKSRIEQIKKVSKLGLRIYSSSKKLPSIKGGKGLTIVSTPQGVMSAQEAKKKNLGGEVICQIW